jgi:hypothetical protein
MYLLVINFCCDSYQFEIKVRMLPFCDGEREWKIKFAGQPCIANFSNVSVKLSYMKD